MDDKTAIGLRNLRRLKAMRADKTITEAEFRREWDLVVRLNSISPDLAKNAEQGAAVQPTERNQDLLEHDDADEGSNSAGCWGCLTILIALSLTARAIEYFSPDEAAPPEVAVVEGEAPADTVEPEPAEAFEQNLPAAAPKARGDAAALKASTITSVEFEPEKTVSDKDIGQPVVAENVSTTLQNPAVPRNDPARWIRDRDYPRSARREQREGTVVFQLSVKPNGRVDSCRIIVSSGHEDLDRVACEKVTARARFRKPENGYGDLYSSSVVWVLENR